MEKLYEKYTIINCLHQNESNAVYLSEHRELGTKRIIKKMSKENNFQLPEVDILKRLSHPNIPKIIDITEDEEAVYLIREYAEGKNLEQWKAEKEKWTEDELVAIAQQLCGVLNYLHKGLESPIVYRDLKPENIILDQNGYLSLIDFGIARQTTPERMRDTYFLGTKAYAAPEQFGAFRSDEKSDIYAFGMTLYYLLGGHKLSEPPYRRLDRETWQTEYSQELIRLIYDCSEPQREKRPESFAEIQERLRNLESDDRHSLTIPKNAKIYLGVRAGAGTSFVLYAHAFAEAKNGKRVAIWDWSENQQIEKLNYVMDTVEVKKYSFELDGLEIYPNRKEQKRKHDWQQYDEIFIDYGVLTGEKRKQLAEYTQQIRFVCSGAPWDMVDLDEVIFNERLIDRTFILNLAEEETRIKLKEEYPQALFEIFPYQKSWYDYAYRIPFNAEQKTPNNLFQKIKNLKIKS